jgi:glycosyltransferase involved in cell wall biosynthesis
MKLLIFASVPPPIHGQNVMVEALVKGLQHDQRFQVFHVDPGLSRSNQQIGRWEFAKVLRLLRACFRALTLRLRHGRMYFYYVPAPAKSSAIARDWLVMMLCRAFFPERVLHWHAVGLGGWTRANRSTWSARLTYRAHAGAALSIVLAPELAEDAEIFKPRRVIAVANGVVDPASNVRRKPADPIGPLRVLFLGAGSREKGLIRAIAAVEKANELSAGQFHLRFAGSFAEPDIQRRFTEAASRSGGNIEYVGFADNERKAALLAESDVLLFPTSYPHEGQPLVLIEALAFDLLIIASRWRAIPKMLPADGVWLVDPDDIDGITSALIEAANPRAAHTGTRRAHFEAHYLLAKHLERISSTLLHVSGEAPDKPVPTDQLRSSS